MSKISILILMLTIVSCSSVKKTGDAKTDAVLEHMSQAPRVMGKDWEERFTKDGFIEGNYVAIGSSTTNDLNGKEGGIRVNTEAIATGALLKSAPTDFKKVIKRVLNSLDNNEGSTTEDQISVTEVKALTGLNSSFGDFQCVKKAIPNKELKYDFAKECRVIVRVPAKNLIDAYDFTLDSKYGISKKNQVETLLQNELMK